ncbi:MAG: hypothetical protein AABW91_01210 [Nanoarchaeota archaeon]
MKRKLSPQNPLEHAKIYLRKAEELVLDNYGNENIPESIKDLYMYARDLAESLGEDVSGLPEKLDEMGVFIAEYRNPAFEMAKEAQKKLFDPKIPSSWEDLPDKYSIR